MKRREFLSLAGASITYVGTSKIGRASGLLIGSPKSIARPNKWQPFADPYNNWSEIFSQNMVIHAVTNLNNTGDGAFPPHVNNANAALNSNKFIFFLCGGTMRRGLNAAGSDDGSTTYLIDQNGKRKVYFGGTAPTLFYVSRSGLELGRTMQTDCCAFQIIDGIGFQSYATAGGICKRGTPSGNNDGFICSGPTGTLGNSIPYSDVYSPHGLFMRRVPVLSGEDELMSIYRTARIVIDQCSFFAPVANNATLINVTSRVGDFQIGEIVTATPSGKFGTVIAFNNTTGDNIWVQQNSNFTNTNGETLTGSVSGATATISNNPDNNAYHDYGILVGQSSEGYIGNSQIFGIIQRGPEVSATQPLDNEFVTGTTVMVVRNQFTIGTNRSSSSQSLLAVKAYGTNGVVIPFSADMQGCVQYNPLNTSNDAAYALSRLAASSGLEENDESRFYANLIFFRNPSGQWVQNGIIDPTSLIMRTGTPLTLNNVDGPLFTKEQILNRTTEALIDITPQWMKDIVNNYRAGVMPVLGLGADAFNEDLTLQPAVLYNNEASEAAAIAAFETDFLNNYLDILGNPATVGSTISGIVGMQMYKDACERYY